MESQLFGKKILIASVPADGHFNPLTGLIKPLTDAGCEVRWYTSGMYAERIARMGIHHYPFIKALEVNGKNIAKLFPEIKTNDPAKRITIYRTQYAKRSTECFEDITDILQSYHADLILTDSLFPAIPFLKHLLPLPLIAIGVIPLPENSVDTAPYGLALPPPIDNQQREKYARLYKEVPELYKEATDQFEFLLLKKNIPYERSLMESMLVSYPDLYLQIGVPDFEYERSDIGSNVRFIGGLLPLSLKADNCEWFDERLLLYNKIVIVTQGTVETDPRKLIEPTLKAFRGTDVLVIATTGGNATQALKEVYNDHNIIIEDFIRFEVILRYADVYITNGGYGGVMQSIIHQVPMVCAGLHEGKNEVCARIDYFGIGVNLSTETPSSGDIYSGVMKILNENKYKKKVENLAVQLNAFDPAALFLQYVRDTLLTER